MNKRLLIGLTLLFVWIGLLFYQSFSVEGVFTVLTNFYFSDKITIPVKGELLSGNKISGQFTATNEFLGIVGFRFRTFYRLNDDFLKFSLREKGSAKWYYQGLYKTDQFQPDQYFPFGFLSIPNSKGKVYEYEIESTAGKPGDAVGMSTINPVLIVKYKYPKSEVTSDKSKMLNFIIVKFINLITSSPSTSFIYLLPLLIFVIKNRKLNLILILAGLTADILLIPASQISIWVLLIILIYYLLNNRSYWNQAFIFAMTLLILSTLTYYLGPNSVSERLGAWSWILFSIWVIHQIWNSRKAS